MARSIPSGPIPTPPPPPLALPAAFVLIWKLCQMPHGGASLRAQMSHVGASERVQMASLWNKKTIIAHEFKYFYRICCSSNHFFTAKTATFSRTVNAFFFLSSLVCNLKQLCKSLHMLEWNHLLHLKSERAELFWQCPTPGLTFIDKCHHGEEVKKYPTIKLPR